MDIDHSLEVTEVYDRAKACDALFEDYFATLEQIQAGPQLAVCRDHQERFWSWANGLGVYAEPAISLDRRLADHPRIQELVVMLLELIKVNLLEALNSCKSQAFDAPKLSIDFPIFGVPLAAAELAVTGDESPQSEGSKTGLSVAPENPHSRSPWEFCQKVSHEGIEESLKRLVRISKAIQESSKTSLVQKVLHDVEKHESEYSDFKKLAESILERRYPLAEPTLREQILESIIFRRARILRQRKRQERLRTTRQDEKQKQTRDPKISTIGTQRECAAPKFGGAQLELTHEIGGNSRVALPSVAKSIGLSEKPTSIDDEAFKKNFEAIQDKRVLSVSTAWAGKFKYPKPPKGFDCPICYRTYSQVDLGNTTWWRRHVDEDIQIYPCISHDCRLPPKFLSRHSKWIQHMESVHSRHWIRNVHCSAMWYCVIDHDPVELESGGDFKHHLQTSHPIQFGKMNAAEVEMLIESSCVSITRNNDVCPLCHSTPSQLLPPTKPGISNNCHGETPQSQVGNQRKLADHIAEHLLAIVHLSFLGISLESDKSSGAKSSKDEYGNATSYTMNSECDDSSSPSSFEPHRKLTLDVAEDFVAEDLVDEDLNEDWEFVKMLKAPGQDESDILDQSMMGEVLELSGQILREGAKIKNKDMPGDNGTLSSELSAIQALQKITYRVRNTATNDLILATAMMSGMSTVLWSGSEEDPYLLRKCVEALRDRKETIKAQTMDTTHTWHIIKSILLKSAVEAAQSRFEAIVELASKNKAKERKEIQRKAIYEWITPVDFAAQHVDNLSRRQGGTGQWFLNSTTFQRWVQGNLTSLLCYGIPGSGKTILFSTIIEYLQSRFGGDPTVGISYVILSCRRQYEQTPRNLLASILKQLYWTLPADHSLVEEMYNAHGYGATPMSTEEIIACLRSVTSYFTRVYLLVDAVDECRDDEGYRDTFLATIERLHEAANVNYIATSSIRLDIERRLQGASRIEVKARDEDVRMFLDGHMHELPWRVDNKGLISDINYEIIQATNGSFLLAQLNFNTLQHTTSVRELKSALLRISSRIGALDEAYDENIEVIEEQTLNRRSLAKGVLSWLVYARRPLRASELQHALAVNKETTSVTGEDVRAIEIIISVCSGLVTVGRESQVVSLVHITADAYLRENATRLLPDAQQLITETCITYLSLDAFSSGVSGADMRERLERHPLFEYAALEWGHHAKSISPPPEVLISFLMSSQANLEAAFEVVWNRHPISKSGIGIYPTGTPTNFSGLHLAAYFGLREAFSMVLKRSGTEIDLNVRDIAGLTPLSYAIMGGNADFIAWLLSIDEVEVSSKATSESYAPIHIAAIVGNLAGILPFIKSDKADLNAKARGGMAPLAEAADGGYFEIVKALVESGRVDVNSQDDIQRTPLSHAAGGDHVEVVRFLLGTGKANANQVDKFRKTPLNLALEMRGEKTASLLLNSGQADASLSIEDREESTPLDRALKNFGPDHSITKLILDRMRAIGVDTEAAFQAANDKLGYKMSETASYSSGTPEPPSTDISEIDE